jgi:hypothetical protein
LGALARDGSQVVNRSEARREVRIGALALLLIGCGPVMLGHERAHDEGVKPSKPSDASDASEPSEMMDASDPIQVGTGGSTPNVHVSVSVEPVDCGKCFDVRAAGTGGQAPYEFEWDDGTRRGSRLVCPNTRDVTVSVVAHDAAAARSDPQEVTLTPLADAGCPQPAPPITTPPSLLCLENPSFEGTPVANLGQPDAFDAEPWSSCVNVGMPRDVPNTPDIANDTIPQNIVVAPKATDGDTYLALGETEQVSQPFCNTIDADASFSLQLDLSKVDITNGLALPEKVFLEIWGGLAVDCSQRELLWASPALEPGWKTFCVTLHPHSFMNQITLRANSNQTSATPAYLLLDNLKPMDRCP